MIETYNRLPSYLKKYCAIQSYERYTAQDQAVWRFALRQLESFLSEHAVPGYRHGLKKTGISVDEIPRIEVMNEALSEFGWGAMAVEGFIPPITFLEFQARRILPIAVDLRRFDHISYTPAPDIIHEAAGHAPIVADPAYAEYLIKYADLAQRAIFSDYDIRLYEAVRYLSDIKEMPGIEQSTIDAAEARLAAVMEEKVEVSEAGKVSRLYWWTAEYGLMGSIDAPKLYGAGLLSSVMESKSCLSAQTKKLPLSQEAVETAYDITEPQPQLFVAKDYQNLHDTLAEVEAEMSYRVGGLKGLLRARQSEMVNTCQLDSGIQISGKLDGYCADGETIRCLQFSGSCQFSYNDHQLVAQGVVRHPTGCIVPIGRFSAMPTCKDPWLLTNDDLFRLGIRVGHRASLQLDSGLCVDGIVISWYRQDGRLLYITWGNFELRRGLEVFISSQREEFDMPIGSRVVSVFGGPAAREEFGPYAIGDISTKPSVAREFSVRDNKLYSLYGGIRELRREGTTVGAGVLAAKAEAILSEFPEQWLLALELLELATDTTAPPFKKLQALVRDSAPSEETWMVEKGLELYRRAG